MITRIQALNYRCLRYVDQELKPFQLLVGANATGKTTFLEVVSFMGDLVAKGVEAAIRERSSNPDDLLWKRQGDAFELAIEVAIPDDVRSCIEDPGLSHVRYEVAVKTDIDGEGIGLSGETVWLTRGNERKEPQLNPFPDSRPKPASIFLSKRKSKCSNTTRVLRCLPGWHRTERCGCWR